MSRGEPDKGMLTCYMLQELFEPLGMTGCGFGPTTTTTEQPPAQPWGEPCIQSFL